VESVGGSMDSRPGRQGEIQFNHMVKKASELIIKFIKYDEIPEISKKIKAAMNYMVLR
jgi:creatinine amidohydrolase